MKTFTSFKTLLSMLVMLFVGMTAQADNKVYIDDFSIATTDGEVEIALNLTNDATDIRGLEGTITLPAGLTISNDGYGTNQRTKADDTRSAGFMQNFTPSTGLIKLRGIMSSNVIAGNEGAVLYVKVKADETLARTSIIKLSNFTIEHSNGTKEAASVADAVVTRTDAPAATDAMIAVPAEVNLKAGGTAEVTVELENETAVTGFELNVQLPAGVTAQAAKEARLTSTIFNYNTSTGKIFYFSPTAISGNSGAIFKLTLTADETFTADAKLLLTDIVITDATSTPSYLDPVSVTLKAFDTAAEEAAQKAAEEDIAALKAEAEKLVVPEKVAETEDAYAKPAVTAANAAIDAAQAAVDAANAAIATAEQTLADNAGKVSTDGQEAVDAAIVAAKKAVEDAQAAITDAEAAKATAEAALAEAAAEAAAQAALAEAQGKAAELMGAYNEISGYNHPDFFAARNQAGGMLQSLSRGALQNLAMTVGYACSYHNAATDNAENIATAIEQFNTQYEATKAAIEAAKTKKAELEAAEAAAKEAAQTDVTALQEEAASLTIPEELLNSEDPEVQAAVAQAGQAIDAANGTVNAVASILNDPSVYLSSEAGATKFADAKTAAEAAIAAAKAAIDAAIEKDEALKAELAAQAVVQETLDGLTEDLQKLMDDYNKLLSYGNPAIDALVHGIDNDMTRANEAYAAADEMVAQAIEEGNVSTDNALAVKAALDMASLRITDFGEDLDALQPQLAAIEQQAAAEAQAYAAEAMGRLQQLMGKMNGLYYGHPDYQQTYNALYALRGAAAGLLNPLMMGTQTAVGNGTVSTENYQNLKQTRESMEAALVALENGIAAAEALKAELEAAEAAAIEADNLAVDAQETEVADAAAQITDEMRASNNAEVDAALTVADAAKDAAVEAIAAAQAVVDDANVWKSSEAGAQQFAEALEAAQAAVDAYEQAVEAVKVAYENATGISTVSVKKYDEGAWYTLNGQRVETPSKGVFIHNGKKVVIK